MDPQLVGIGLLALAGGAFLAYGWARSRPERRSVARVAVAVIVLVLAGLIGSIAWTVLTLDMRDF